MIPAKRLGVSRPPASDCLIYAAMVAVLAVGFYRLLSVQMDPDETESLAAASYIFDGGVPYRDFWQIHTPLYYYFLAPLFLVFRTMRIFIAGRLVSFVLWLVNGYCLYWIAKRFFTARAAALGVLAYLAFMPFMDKMIEIRPDILVVTLFNLCAIVLLSQRFAPGRSFFVAGMLGGLAVTAKQSGIIAVLALLSFLAVRLIIRRPGFWDDGLFPARRFNPRSCGMFVAGLAVPCIVLGLFLWGSGALGPFLQHAIGNDFLEAATMRETESTHWYPQDILRYYAHTPDIVTWIVLSLSVFGFFVYLLLRFRETGTRVLNGCIFIAVPAVVSTLSLFLILHPWLQEFLLPAQAGALLAGPGLAFVYDRARYLLARLLLLLTLCVPGSVNPCRTGPPKLPRELAMFQRVLSVTNEDDTCIAAYPIPFRPSVYFYLYPANFRESQPARRRFEDSMLYALTNESVVVVVPHVHYESLPRFISAVKERYVLRDDSFYIPGRRLAAGVLTHEIAIAVEGQYRCDNWEGMSVDGKAMMDGRIYLTRGRHTVSVEDDRVKRLLLYDLDENSEGNR